jgi:hypothetical protein
LSSLSRGKCCCRLQDIKQKNVGGWRYKVKEKVAGHRLKREREEVRETQLIEKRPKAVSRPFSRWDGITRAAECTDKSRYHGVRNHETA